MSVAPTGVALTGNTGGPESEYRLALNRNNQWRSRLQILSEPVRPLNEDERAELERLRSENRRLKMEAEFAKKVAAWFAKDQQ